MQHPPDGWNIADAFEVIADHQPAAPAQAHGDRRFTWGEFSSRADGVAGALLAAGVQRQDKVAQYLYNCPEYFESIFACFKAALVPVNTNYRYTDDELVYIWTNSDAVAVIFHASFTETVARLRSRCPKVATWIWVDDGSAPLPPWAQSYDAAAASSPGRVVAPWGRSPDDLCMTYTGGTTGYPKGVMWRQDDSLMVVDAASRVALPDHFDPAALIAKLSPGLVGLPLGPLMHGAAYNNSLSILKGGGCLVLLESRTFDPAAVWTTVTGERVKTLSIIGDAMAKPLLAELDAQPGRWDLSGLRIILSSGVMWSAAVKAGLLAHMPTITMIDSLGSTEALAMASQITSATAPATTARFVVSERTKVIDDAGNEVTPGSGQMGKLAQIGRSPVGYYKDPEKTAATFPVHGGVRYVVPGDFATVDADGTVQLLGRGNQVINSGGEKIFPEEVEEALKLHPSVNDAVAVGVPDDRFGQAVTAVVELMPGATLDVAALIEHVRTKIAGYKAPKHIVEIDTIGRGANSKVNYKRLTAYAREILGV
jgi:3-oxocholest-4-en-26-oate---CoA ligase